MSIYQHFRKHEHPFIDQVLAWKEEVARSYVHYITDFLDPREQLIIEALIGPSNDEIQYSFFGGGENVERKKAVIAPYYEEINENRFKVILLEATFSERFVQLQHRDILGAFISLGIDRKKVGDIIVVADRFQLLVSEELSAYIQMNFTKVSNATIQLKEKPYTDLLDSQDEWVTKHHTVSSLRIDVIVKEIYRMARKDAVHYIKGNRVKVNFTELDDPAIQLIAGDLLSVRGHGRSKIIEIHGTSKKGKLRITTARLKS